MSRMRSPGILGWIRKRAYPRLLIRAWALAVILNVVSPIGFAIAHQGSLLEPCHEYGVSAQTPESDPAAHVGSCCLVGHCPLCVVLGNALGIAPLDAEIGAIAVADAAAVNFTSRDHFRLSPPAAFRPRPRAPPL